MADLTYQDVLTILRFADAAAFSTFELEWKGVKVQIVREVESTPWGARQGHDVGAAGPPEPAGTTAERSLPRPSGGSSAANIPGTTGIRPPMEGTFYAAPSPGAPAFVTIGSRVEKGAQVGTVEVMKLFTPVTAPIDGTIRAIFVENEQAVDKSTVLMAIEPLNGEAEDVG